MINYESNKNDIELVDEVIDLDAEYTEDYHLSHAEALEDLLSLMENDEAKRKSEMEKDAYSKAVRIHEEIVFDNKGDIYQKMISNMRSSVNEEEICQAFASGIFDILGVKEDDRPVLIVSQEETPVVFDTNHYELGHFERPSSRLRDAGPKARRNGIIKINLSSFENTSGLEDIFASLEHECFHAYQFASVMHRTPIKTVRDFIMSDAYHYGMLEHIVPEKDDTEEYYGQGIESSARIFGAQLSRATSILVKDSVRIR
ncbi:MAG: hypothetical protein K5837_05050 [Candidatus Saccharibacteria bacterium]|nr:hypothetical protein [Candidatus Saccharibacteria bacterium]